MLTDATCRRAKPKNKAYKISDAGGLYLFISTSGHKSWRLKYRIAGVERVLTIGPYPDVSLMKAREERGKAKMLLRDGIDPSAEKRRQLQKNLTDDAESFRSVAIEWHYTRKAGWSPDYAKRILRILERNIFPFLGDFRISEITPPSVLKVLRQIEDQGNLTVAQLARVHLSGIFTFAIAMGICSYDPAAMVGKALKHHEKKMVSAITNVAGAQKFLFNLEQKKSISPTIKLMSRLIALTAVRSSVARLAEHSEFLDLDGPRPVWKIPAKKMKLSVKRKNNSLYDFTIPLSRQAVDVVKAAMTLRGKNAWLFPSGRSFDTPPGNATLYRIYASNSGEEPHVPHGWRASFSTIMNERAAKAGRDSDRPIIDMMLAHMTNTVEVTYNRAAYMERRREIAQEWADLLTDGLLPAIELLPR